MKKLLASAAALFIAAAAAPTFAGDVTREDVRASRQQTAQQTSRDEACACPMHATRTAPDAARAGSPSLDYGAREATFTDRG